MWKIFLHGHMLSIAGDGWRVMHLWVLNHLFCVCVCLSLSHTHTFLVPPYLGLYKCLQIRSQGANTTKYTYYIFFWQYESGFMKLALILLSRLFLAVELLLYGDNVFFFGNFFIMQVQKKKNAQIKFWEKITKFSTLKKKSHLLNLLYSCKKWN
jgi:hypothetical protein